MNALPLFPVTTVGSWPRPKDLLRAQKLKRQGQLSESEFSQLADEAVLRAIHLQEEAGVDVVTDGEQRRDNFYSFVAEKLNGVRMMTLAEMLDVVEDKTALSVSFKPSTSRLSPLATLPALAESSGGSRWRWMNSGFSRSIQINQ